MKMLRDLFVVLALLWGLVFCMSAAAASPRDPLASYRAIGQVHTSAGQGSGTLIGVRGNVALVLCCRHLCERAGEMVTVKWLWAGGQVSQGQVIEIVPGGGFETDLALIVCNRPQGVEPVKLARFRPQDGPWISAGFRDGQLRYATANAALVQGNLIVFDSAFIGGMSGGATFNRRGEQIAVVVASDRKTIGVSVDGELLHAFVNKFRRNQVGK